MSADSEHLDAYTYDATGNRTSFANAAGTQAYLYAPGSHHLASIDAVARSYDAAGNTTSIGGTTKTFVYDATNRLSEVTASSVTLRQYAYNGLGERVRSYLGSSSTYSVYDEAGRWLGDYDGSGSPIQQAVWMDDLPVGLLVGASPATGRLHYIQPDHLGTPRVVIEPARDVAVWTWDLKGEAFGDSAPNEDPDGDSVAFVLDMRFPGQRYDAASGLNYNYFRDYEAASGRYVQSDPIGLEGDVSTYAYSGGDPLLLIDPYGLTKGKGERGWAQSPGGTNDPFKHYRPHPTDPNKVIYNDPRTGKKITKPRPPGFPVKSGGALPLFFMERMMHEQCMRGDPRACATWCEMNPVGCAEELGEYGPTAAASCPSIEIGRARQ